MPTKNFDQGALVRVFGVFTNSAGTAIDPTTVKIAYRADAIGTTTIWTYGTDAEVVRSATGTYYADIDSNESPGRYEWNIYSVGTGQAADNGDFYIRRVLTTPAPPSDPMTTLNSTNVTFLQSGSGAVVRDVRDRLMETVSVLDFNVTGDGTTDDTIGLQAAIDATPTGGVLIVPDGTYIASNLTINRPMTFRGENWGAKIKAKSGSTGYLLTIEAGSVLEEGNWLTSVRVAHLNFDGNSRGSSIGAIKLVSVEWSQFDHLRIFDFQREALNVYSNVRECNFSQIWCRYCGDKDNSYPVINLKDQDTSTADANNFLYFTEIASALQLGDHVLIDTVAGKTLNGSPITTRDVSFVNCYFHGIVSALDGLPYTYTTAQKTTKMFSIKAASNIFIDDARMYIVDQGQPYVEILNGTHATSPSNIVLNGSVLEGRYDLSGTLTAIDINHGDVKITNSVIDGPTTAIDAASGTVIRLGTTNEYGGTLTIADNARPTLTMPVDMTVTKALRVSDSVQDDLVGLNLNNTKSGGHNYQVAGGSGASGNSAGGFYLYDITDLRRVWQVESNGRFAVDRAITSGTSTLSYTSTVATDAALANTFNLTATGTGDFTISNPTNASSGQNISYIIINSSGGAMGVITWGSGGNFRLSGAFTNPATGFLRTISFVFNGSWWVETSRTTTDH